MQRNTEGRSPTDSTFSSASASASISSFESNSSESRRNSKLDHALQKPEHPTHDHLVDSSFNVALNNSYEYMSSFSFESDSFETSAKSGSLQDDDDVSGEDDLKSLSDRIRIEIEKLAAKSMTGEVNKRLDETFISCLFEVFYRTNFKLENFRQIQAELVQTNVMRSQQFLALAKLGHECFKIGLLTTSECLFELALNRIDTTSQRLKMAILSTLSACYWRQSKYINAIDCMHKELELAVQLGKQCQSEIKNTYAYNRLGKFYILGYRKISAQLTFVWSL